MLCITKIHFCDSQVICIVSVFHTIIIQAEFNNNNYNDDNDNNNDNNNDNYLLIGYIAGFWTQIEKHFNSQNCENTMQFQTINMYISLYMKTWLENLPLTIHHSWQITTTTLMS